jgi:hypothetical protein
VSLDCVKVPSTLEAEFEKAAIYVKEFYRQEKQDLSAGTLSIGKQRYILIRAASMSFEFLEFFKSKYQGANEDDAFTAASRLLFDMAHSIGKSDARNFSTEMNVHEPMARLSAGPIHFAYSGWSFMDILSESKPTPDKNFCLIYSHPHSFEADSWIEAKKHTSRPVCMMNAGYSSGWCEESYGLPLTSIEILCRAKGDKYCMFIMAPPDKVNAIEEDFRKHHPELFA